MREISVIGLGAMGSALAGTLLEHGYRVTVWNRTPAKAGPLVAAGALLARTSAEAVAASPVTIVCIGTHSDTRDVLESSVDNLAGKHIIELSTGDHEQAESLTAWIAAHGGDSLVGMILSFPAGIGGDDAAIICAGAGTVWADNRDAILALGRNSSYAGEQVGALAVLFTALFLPRQGFMFGMIYGALLCEKSGVPVSTYVEQLPQAVRVADDYRQVVAATIPDENYADPPASINVYDAAFRDSLAAFQDRGINLEFPNLMHDLVKRGVAAGLGDEQLTALIKVLRRS